MKQLLETIGAGDGLGNISHTRLINLAIAMCYLGSKFYNAHLTHAPITWDSNDLYIIGAIGGVSIGKTIVENQTKPTPPVTAETKPTGTP